MSEAVPIPSAVVDEAIAWSVKLHFGEPDSATRAAFERWRQAAAVHERAWSRMQSLNADFAAVPQRLALDTLTAMGGAHQARRQQRRAVLKGLVLAGGVLGTGWVVREHTPWQRVLADVSTGVGRRGRRTLPDGTELALNTDTAVAVRMDGAERVLVLYRGEVSIATGADAAHAARRPFFVQTPFGAVQALGTRFVVRLDDDSARVSVQQDAVALRPANGAAPVVAEAGQDWRLDRQRAVRIVAPAMASDAWIEGAVVGKNMRLADLLAELARYRHGRIRCAPEIADLRVSGTYHVNDVDQALQFLAQTLPIRVRYWTRFWITVGPA
ncbi:MAG: FecR domain-containing protein [Bordetella sp.]|nr:FecR domain-containing protein [Bordetella sp.]